MSGREEKPSDEMGELLEQLLDDRDSLTDAQWARLLEVLRDSPELLASLKDQLLLDEVLSQRHAIDRRNFPAQVTQRLLDEQRDEGELQRQVDEMRQLAFEEFADQRRRRRPVLRMLAAAALVLIAFGAGAWYVLPGVNDRPQVARIYGGATLVRDEVREPLEPGERLKYGDRLLTGAQAFVVLDYPDGTVLNIGGQSLLQFSTRFRSGKIVEVERGAVASRVAVQPRRRPMRFLTPRADAKVVGTELLLEVTGSQTRLNVAEGKVELRGLSNSRAVLVGARQYGIADGQKVVVDRLAWPSSPRGLQLLVEPGLETPPASWELRGAAEWDGRFRFRGGSAVAPAEVSRQVTDACQRSGEMSLELVLRSDSLQQRGPARIVTLSSDGFNRNFTLGQQDGHLIFRLRTPVTVANGAQPEVRLCRLPDRLPHHLLVTYRDGRLACYLDGQQVGQLLDVQGDLSNWTDHYLTLASEWDGDAARGWRGEVLGLAVYSRVLDAKEGLRNAAALRTLTMP